MIDDLSISTLASLLAAGFDLEEALDILKQATDAYDRAGKGYGQHSGPLGSAGCAVFERLLHEHALDRFTPYRTADVAKAMKLARTTVHKALERLSVHGFLIQEKKGYRFSYMLAVPEAALRALADECEDPGLNEWSRELGARVRSLLSPAAS